VNERVGNILFLFGIVSLLFLYYQDVMSLDNWEEKIVVFTLFWAFFVLVAINMVQLIVEIVKKRYIISREDLFDSFKGFNGGHFIRDKKFILLSSTLIYILLIHLFGFFIPSFFFFIILSYILGMRNIWTLISVPAVIVILSYLVFIKLLNVYMPSGILFL
jgi:hypothetical protein